MICTASSCSYDDIRRIVLSVIKKNDFSQYSHIESQVANVLLNQNLINKTNNYSTTSSYGTISLSASDSDKVNQVVWDLIIERILTIGHNGCNDSWPFLRLTEQGKRVIESGDTIFVYDIDGMLKKLKTTIPDVDPIIVNYFSECLNTYRIDALLASSVMLGCATEKAITLLYDAYANWVKNKFSEKEYQNLEKCQSKVISKKFDTLTNSIKSHTNDIDDALIEDFDLFVNALFAIIRKNRNEAGHPTGKRVDRDELRSMIYVFTNHCKKIYEYIDYFSKN